MPATVTLGTTTLTDAVSPTDGQIKVATTAGILPGMCLYFDGELVKVLRLGVDPLVFVTRGEGSSPALPHASGCIVYIGQPHQFYRQDPTGRPNASIAVSPYINVRNGSLWFAQGDATPSNTANRWWQKQTATYGVGALGVRSIVLDPESST